MNTVEALVCIAQTLMRARYPGEMSAQRRANLIVKCVHDAGTLLPQAICDERWAARQELKRRYCLTEGA